jgi:hypothetical protein
MDAVLHARGAYKRTVDPLCSQFAARGGWDGQQADADLVEAVKIAARSHCIMCSARPCVLFVHSLYSICCERRLGCRRMGGPELLAPSVHDLGL